LLSPVLSPPAGAHPALVGADARRAARRALPPSMRARAEVSDSGTVSVRVAVPHLLPGLPRFTVGARTQLGSGDG
jgi:hypothetical protein